MVTRQALSPALAEAAINKAMEEANAADRKVMEMLDRLSDVEDDRNSYASDADWEAAVEAAEREAEAAQEERDNAESNFQNEMNYWNEDVDEDEDD